MSTKPLNRRSFLARVSGGAIVAGGAAMAFVAHSPALAIDRDSSDFVTHTDRDASDLPGHGGVRGPRRPRLTGRRRRAAPASGISDRDPGDMVGHGTGGVRRRRRRRR